MAIGRISGPLLKANLLREGVDLAFETDLLYLNVNDSRIGINTASPQYDLDVNGTIKSSGLEVSTLANIADITFTGNTISTTQPTLELGTADTVVYQNKLTIDSISVENNVISTNTTNENLEFRPNGTGTVENRGFLTVAGTGVTGSASTTAIAGPNVIGGFTADNVIDLVYSLDGSLRSRPSFALLANSGSIAALRKLKDAQGRYLFDVGVGQERRDLVLGVPVIETPAMPSIGSATTPLAVGDLKSLYVRNAGGLQVDRSDDFAFGNDLATWRATWRLDSALVQTANIKVFKGGTA